MCNRSGAGAAPLATGAPTLAGSLAASPVAMSPATLTLAGEPTMAAVAGSASPAKDPIAQAAPPDSGALVVQAIASFGASDAGTSSTGPVLTAGPAQLSEIVAPSDRPMSHA